MLLDVLMIQKDINRHKKCVNDLLQNLCTPELDNSKKSKTLEYLVKCFLLDLKTYTELACQVLEDKNIELIH